VGFRDKACGMPLWALGLNIAWEAIYAYMDISLGKSGFIQGQWIISLVWVTLDAVILYTYFKYEESKFPVSRKYFVSWSILVIVCCFLLQIGLLNTFGFQLGSRYSAFIQNLAMSVMFVQAFAPDYVSKEKIIQMYEKDSARFSNILNYIYTIEGNIHISKTGYEPNKSDVIDR